MIGWDSLILLNLWFTDLLCTLNFKYLTVLCCAMLCYTMLCLCYATPHMPHTINYDWVHFILSCCVENIQLWGPLNIGMISPFENFGKMNQFGPKTFQGFKTSQYKNILQKLDSWPLLWYFPSSRWMPVV